MWKKIPIVTILSVGVVILFVYAMSFLENTNNQEKTKTLEDLIMRTALHCYSLEGAYPSEISYLEENYQLIIDRDRYIVHYENFADNITPDITVITK